MASDLSDISKNLENQIAEDKDEAVIKFSGTRQSLYRMLATLNIIFGFWYISWRWSGTINPDAPIFSYIVLCAETSAYIALLFVTYNLWTDYEVISPLPPTSMFECIDTKDRSNHSQNINKNIRQIGVDIFIATYNEPTEIVALTIEDAKTVKHTTGVDLNIYLLDDGNRLEMKELASNYGIKYLPRTNNAGYKAGNLCNGLFYSYGDFVVICDADTRLYPEFLDKTLGFFQDPLMAWVQTPQWFYDIPSGVKPSHFFYKIMGKVGQIFGMALEKLGIKTMLRDPWCSDPKLFYEIFLRRRNAANAAFCCGAGSIHRREALYEVALYHYLQDEKKIDNQKALSKERIIFAPIKLHISEDIYTSLLIHSYHKKKWRSVYLPKILSRMLSAKDFISRYKQLSRYSTGALDMAKNNINLFFSKGLTAPQKIIYFSTIFSYLSSIWQLILFVTPCIYLFTNVPPVHVDYREMVKHIVPFIIISELTLMAGLYGANNFAHRSVNLANFSINLIALYNVLIKSNLKFHVTAKTRSKDGYYLALIMPQIFIIAVSILGIFYALWQWSNGDFNAPATALTINIVWVIFNISILGRFVLGALYDDSEIEEKTYDPELVPILTSNNSAGASNVI